MAKTSSTTLKVPVTLKTRIGKLAKRSGRTPHALMLDALERQVQREEWMASFIEEAREADRQIDAGGDVFAAEDVHAWLEALGRGEKPARPKPWRS